MDVYTFQSFSPPQHLLLATVAAVIGPLLLLFAWSCSKWLSQQRLPNPPPSKKGWIPWLGVGLQFGKAPLYYIKRVHEELGDIFTIYAVGKRMTFLLDYKDSSTYFKTPSASFKEAAIDFTTAAASIEPTSFSEHHTKIHDIFKGQLTMHHLDPLCQELSLSFYHEILLQVREREGQEVEMELMDFVRKTMFGPVVKQLFGQSNLQLSEEEIKSMLTNFIKYDADFKYAQLPAIFNREWGSTKEYLLNIMKKVVGRVPKQADCLKHAAEHIISAVDPANAPGYSLMVLWASQANAIPISFWTLSFILSHPNVYKKIKEELKEWPLFQKDETSFNAVKEEDLKAAPPTIKRAILEAIRLRSPGMIARKVTEPIKIKEYTVPAGHYLMMSPYHSHRNQTYFPDPETFNPERWLECDIDKNQFLPGFIAFGGGRYQCPGRWFALMELHLYISMILKLLDMTLIDEVPKPSPLHLTGSQQPEGSCFVKIKLK
ncbi:PREDICTED: 24-hydroxycholesterol 7-alpha-hydroxylase-like isoform X1 [Amphimedon queenslandica]|uniref:Cytochrome P450 n=1 Tax=Amphimedon queenslandica TaxID=400682 RepID=A0A1X7UIL2_AMPQE|nr:PREDICTED: 24-hydroxycholesterol 7-alpha-hydroxylase-like isoform X1 [Amphimedon queenslandica]|eukprot:XP_003387846.1 PREDICTED: 24-hydroxycholesterol 7-alpha-hydroxylase-like isoform X1 [Amphimedon queenslandica]